MVKGAAFGILLALSTWAHAQKTIVGKILDEKQKPLKGITVLLLWQKDSSLQKSSITNGEGIFSVMINDDKQYLLQLSGVGLQTKYIVLKDQKELGDIILKQQVNEIAGVTVVASKPFLEQRADKLVVNVENSATAAGATALEILQKVPGVIVSNEKISLAGRNNVGILIDGKSTQYTDINQVLASMGASNIEKIEVMVNPGARYDAQGGSLINIILKKNANLGTNGTIGLAVSQGIYEKGQYGVDRNYYRVIPSMSINHRKGKWNVYGSGNFFHRNFFDYSEFDRAISPFKFSQTNYSPANRNTINYRAGVDFYANKKNTFGFLIRGFDFQGITETVNNTKQNNANSGALISTFRTDIYNDSRRNNRAANINWKHIFDTSEHFLNIDADYAQFDITNRGDITNTLANGNSYINNQDINNPVKFLVLKADYGKPIGKTRLLEAGSKFSFATIDNYLVFIGNGVYDSKRSTNFRYRENINAAYINLKQQLGEKWELITGLRTEQTVAKGTNSGAEVLNRDYWQLFPSVFLTRKLNKHFATGIQYVRRVNRPGYQQQNPFIEFLDSLTYTQGNPLLRPETSDQYKFSLNYDNQPFFAISYNKTNDVIFDNAPRQQGNLTFTTPENLAKFENLVFELNFPINIGKKISGFGGNQFIWNHYATEYLGTNYDRQKWNWQAYWQVAYKPRTDWNIEVSGFYTTNFLNEFITIRELGNLNMAVQKSFMEKKLRVTLNINDMFFTQRSDGSLQYQNIDVAFRQRNESRNIRLAISYSFGNQQLKAARNRSTGSDAESSRVKTN